jgi:hypothetical protein
MIKIVLVMMGDDEGEDDDVDDDDGDGDDECGDDECGDDDDNCYYYGTIIIDIMHDMFIVTVMNDDDY